MTRWGRLLPAGALALMALAAVAPAQEARLEAPAQAEIGASIAVDWHLAAPPPEGSADFLAVARPDDPPGEGATHAWPRSGATALRLPLQPGGWELRYVADRPGEAPQVLAAQPLDLTDRLVTLDAPEIVGAGDTVAVRHDGPGWAADYLTVAVPGSPDDAYLGYAYVGGAPELAIVAPLAPGRYELRYVGSGNIERVLGRRALAVQVRPLQLVAPEAAPAGSLLSVAWDGPQNDYDYLEVARLGQPAGTSGAASYTRGGSPLEIVLPLEPGDYEIRYVYNVEDRPEILARRPLRVQAVSAALEAPGTVVQGAALPVGWQGPANRGDFVAIARPEAAPRDSLSYAFLQPDAPLRLTAPLEPGGYELRYVAHGSPDRVLARQPLLVRPAELALDAPAQALGGATLSMDWQGPGNGGDRLVLARPGDAADQMLAFARLRPDQPAQLQLPPQPGSYELRYLAAGRPAAVLARWPLTIAAAPASLTAAPEAVEGSRLAVDWQGPAHAGDRIGLAAPGAPPEALLAWTPVAPGAQDGAGRLALDLPAGAGPYELRYLAAGRPGAVLASRPLTLTAAEASLEPPAGAPDGVVGQGTALSVAFTGPAGPQDRVQIAPPGASPGAALAESGLLQAGLPARLRAPAEPGTYRLRYLLGAGPRVLAERPLEVVALPAALSAADRAPAGADLEVLWQGPGGAQDRIVLARPEAPPGEAVAAVRPRPGAPARLALPLEPGAWELRYQVPGLPGEAAQVLARRPLTLDAPGAALQAPAQAEAGGALEVSWQGPGATRDYLALFAPDEAAPRARAWVLAGSPLVLPLPDEPGAYRLAYVSGRGDTVLAEQTLELQ